VPEVIDRLARSYLNMRKPRELFIDAVERLGAEAFKAALRSEEAVAA
jgi:hypothetical protein